MYKKEARLTEGQKRGPLSIKAKKVVSIVLERLFLIEKGAYTEGSPSNTKAAQRFSWDGFFWIYDSGINRSIDKNVSDGCPITHDVFRTVGTDAKLNVQAACQVRKCVIRRGR
jgi:hypothetical protein